MTVMIARWFGVPPELYEYELVAEMSGSKFQLCMFLYWLSDKRSSRRCEMKDKDVSRRTGVSVRALQGARTRLCDLGIVTCAKLPGGTYTYELCGLYTKKPYPGDPAKKAPYMKRKKLDITNESSIRTSPQKAALEKNVTQTEDLTETAFPYGHNADRKEGQIDPVQFSPFGLSEFTPFFDLSDKC
jgi:hypothetical protein